MVDLTQIAENVIRGQAPTVKQLVEDSLAENIPVGEILNEGLIAGMNVVGEKFKNNEFYIPEVLIAARAMKAGMELVRPLLTESGIDPVGTVAIGTVKGDLHDIGKNLVQMMLEGAGFEIVDLGIDVSADQFISAVRTDGAQIIAMSALLTTTMPTMKTVIDEVEESGLRDQVKVMIGGAPVTQEYADEIGADGYARDAASGVDIAKQLVGLPAA
ncbi:MAG: corrinoid protein [Candidatus Poribacteria bacterium]|jgi:5-methyltetrahydrofolate--homocysteine methyltransferase|nr:corrinoid protein [Candidatus Poribacteria bacterium]MDP6748466.1 corrinoid protein [Candidatus Poribacteria bacterium]MDP6995260.1 corrinoid protein [Candidatus Poribacteria bacterium]